MSYLPRYFKNVLIFNTFRLQSSRTLSYLNASNDFILTLKQNHPATVKVNKTFVRFKYAKKGDKVEKNNDNDDDDDSDFSQINFKKDSNLARISVNSLRTDLILKAALNLARK